MVQFRGAELEKKAQIWAKLEFLNPGGSLKDRMCLNIIHSMERDGLLGEGGRLVEASCGNTAISLAAIAAAKGYVLTLVMPETVHQYKGAVPGGLRGGNSPYSSFSRDERRN